MRSLRCWVGHHSDFIAILLQTRRYAWKLISSRNDSRLDLVQCTVDLRMARQHILDRPNASRLNVVVDRLVVRPRHDDVAVTCPADGY